MKIEYNANEGYLYLTPETEADHKTLAEQFGAVSWEVAGGHRLVKACDREVTLLPDGRVQIRVAEEWSNDD